MDNKFTNRNETNEGKSKAKAFWKFVGCIFLALILSIITVFVLNLNLKV